MKKSRSRFFRYHIIQDGKGASIWLHFWVSARSLSDSQVDNAWPWSASPSFISMTWSKISFNRLGRYKALGSVKTSQHLRCFQVKISNSANIYTAALDKRIRQARVNFIRMPFSGYTKGLRWLTTSSLSEPLVLAESETLLRSEYIPKLWKTRAKSPWKGLTPPEWSPEIEKYPLREHIYLI